MAFLVKCMDRVGVERLLLSQGYSADQHPNPAAQFRLENDRVMRAVKAFPDRAYGSVYLTPALLDFSMQELNRCVRDGPMVMIGEIEAEVRCNVPEMDPIAEWAVAMQVPILQHEWLNAMGNQAGESRPSDVVELAKRHPKLQIVSATWEETGSMEFARSAARRMSTPVSRDSTRAQGVVEMAVRELGAERVIFGSDVGGRSFASQLAKVLSADIPDAAKELILGGNLAPAADAHSEKKRLPRLISDHGQNA